MTAPWPEVPLTVVADLVRGVSYPKTDSRDDPAAGYVPVLRATNIQDARLVLESDLVYVAESNISLEQRLRPGDIVIATSSGSKHLVGKSALLHAHWSGSFGAFCAGIRPKPNIESRYLAYFLQSPRYWKEIGKKALGVNINNLRRGDLETLSLPLPPSESQREIVAEIEKQFSRLDEAVANLQRVKANLKRYRATVLQGALEGHLTPADAVSEMVPLKKLIGRISQGWSPKCDLTREPLIDEWAIITTTAVQPMRYVDNQGKKLPPAFEPRTALEIMSGDFLVTRKGPRKRAGVACLVRTTRPRLMVCDTVYRFRCDPSKVVPDYLELALNAPSTVGAIDRQKAGINESGVSLTHDKLGGVLIPVPSIDAQSLIVAEVDRRLSIVREVEAEVDANLKRAKALRQSILSAAFAMRGPRETMEAL